MRTSSRSRFVRSVVVLASLSLSLGLLAPAVDAAGTKLGDYRFNGNTKNSVKQSPIGNLALIEDEGTGAFVQVNVDGTMKTALEFTQGFGLRATGIPVAVRKNYTIEAFFEFDSMNGYERILSFGPNDRDDGLYFYADPDIGDPDLMGLYSERETELPFILENNEWYRVRVIRNGKTQKMAVFVDGQKVLGYKDVANVYLLRQGQIVFFRDDGSEDTAGTVSNIRIWKGAVPA